MDLHDGSALLGALLIVVSTGQAVQTDLDGKFSIPKLCEDSYNIKVSHSFCKAKMYTVISLAIQ